MSNSTHLFLNGLISPTSRKDGRVCERPAGSPLAYETAILLVSSSGLRLWDIGEEKKSG